MTSPQGMLADELADWFFREDFNEATRSLINRTVAILRQAAAPGGQKASNSIDHQQRRGVAWDIIDEAINSYDEWMLDDNYDFCNILSKIIVQMRARRELYAPADAGTGEKIPQDENTIAQTAQIIIDRLLQENRQLREAPVEDGDSRAIIDMLCLCGELGGKQNGETYTQYLRRLIDEIAAPPPQVDSGREDKLVKALRSVREELWVDHCLHMGRTDTDPRPFNSKPHIRIIDDALRPERSAI